VFVYTCTVGDSEKMVGMASGGEDELAVRRIHTTPLVQPQWELIHEIMRASDARCA
jgi:hypothetical protein